MTPLQQSRPTWPLAHIVCPQAASMRISRKFPSDSREDLISTSRPPLARPLIVLYVYQPHVDETSKDKLWQGQAPAKHHLQYPSARTVRDSVHGGASRHQRHPIGVCEPNEAYYIFRLFPAQIVVGSLSSRRAYNRSAHSRWVICPVNVLAV